MTALTGAQNGVLDQLAARIGDICDRARAPGVVEATGVLDRGLGFTAADYGIFRERLAATYSRLGELRTAERVAINDALDPSMGALTQTHEEEARVVLLLRSATVSPDAEAPLARRVFTLVHELSHALREPVANGRADTFEHPVRDYTYRNTWAQGYLAGEVGARNADTYSEAAAIIAEGLEGRPPGFYRETGMLPAQRRYLQGLARGGITLGPALAWADIKINRAWLRASDVQAEISSSFDIVRAGLELRDVETSAQSRAKVIEQLRSLKILGSREIMANLAYSADSQAAAAAITSAMGQVKNWLASVLLYFPPDGQVTFDADSHKLTVPLGQLALPPVKLADVILSALLGQVKFPPGLPAATPLAVNVRGILEMLYDNDRAYEAPQVQALRDAFSGLPAAPVPLSVRGILPTAVAVAGIDGLAEYWAATRPRFAQRGAAALGRADIFEAAVVRPLNWAAGAASGLAQVKFLPERGHLAAVLGQMVVDVTAVRDSIGAALPNLAEVRARADGPILGLAAAAALLSHTP